MNDQIRLPGLSWLRRRQSGAVLPEVAIFSGLRSRLTLWYSGVLAVALLLLGVGLYFGVQQVLFTGVNSDLAHYASQRVAQLQHGIADFSCSSAALPLLDHSGPDDQYGPIPVMSACYNQNAHLILDTGTFQLPPAFLNNNLAQTALQSDHPVTDIVNTGGTMGRIERYATVTYVPYLRQHLVVQVAESVEPEESALQVLLTLLLIGAIVVLLLAGVGGYFLANRALIPARLAFSRQQRFIADASHELRTPLTLLRADAEVLLYDKERLGTEDTMLLENITTEANHMSTLLSSMLTLARLDAGKQHQEYEVVHLDELARAGMQRVSAFASQSGITLRVEKSSAAMVIGDPMLLEQALLVVLDNAVKYNRTGGSVTLRTSSSNGQARLEIMDTGIGIPAEHLPHLGERFYRVDKARSRAAGGNGLGLSIAQHVLSLHGGSLTLASTPGQGTLVTFTLPAAKGAPVSPEAQEQTSSSPLLRGNS
ncbi:MAG TPA: ATP-binding protein [Ktedonobacterales bacterium]|jgi:signal transduction histidine kinase